MEDERSFKLIMAAIDAVSNAVSALTLTVQGMSQKLAERYLTRDEDDRADRDMRDQLYAYVREQGALERKTSDDTHRDMREYFNNRLAILQWIIGTLATIQIAIDSWFIMKGNK